MSLIKENLENDEQIFQSEKGALVLQQNLGAEVLLCLFRLLRAMETHDNDNTIFQSLTGDFNRALKSWEASLEKDEKRELYLKGQHFFLDNIRIRAKPRFLKKIRYLSNFLKKRGIQGFALPKTSDNHRELKFFKLLHGLDRSSTQSECLQKLREENLSDYDVSSLLWSESKTADKQTTLDLYREQLLKHISPLCENFELACKDSSPFIIDKILHELTGVDDSEFFAHFSYIGSEENSQPMAHIAVDACFILFRWAKSLGLPSGVIIELASCALAYPLSLLNRSADQSLGANDAARAKLIFQNVEKIKPRWKLSHLQTLSLYEFAIPFGHNGIYELNSFKCYQHFFSRMLRIVLLYTQLISFDRRRKSVTPHEAIKRMLCTNIGCDQSLVKLFVQWLGIYPSGSLVQLTSGEIARVCSTSSDLSETVRPSVCVLTDREGQALQNSEIRNLNSVNEKSATHETAIKGESKSDNLLAQALNKKELADLLLFSWD